MRALNFILFLIDVPVRPGQLSPTIVSDEALGEEAAAPAPAPVAGGEFIQEQDVLHGHVGECILTLLLFIIELLLCSLVLVLTLIELFLLQYAMHPKEQRL